MKGSQDISVYFLIVFFLFCFSFLFVQMFFPFEELSPCEKINKYVPNLKLNCEELEMSLNFIPLEAKSTKKIQDEERKRLLQYIKSLQDE